MPASASSGRRSSIGIGSRVGPPKGSLPGPMFQTPAPTPFTPILLFKRMGDDMGRPREQSAALLSLAKSRHLRARVRLGTVRSMSAAAPLRVFLSYAHEDAKHRVRVKALAQRLQDAGMDV